MSTASISRDRRIVLWLAGGVAILIALTAIVAPAANDDDTVPTIYNTGTSGARAAYLLLQNIGYTVEKPDESAAQLDQVDAPNTTYILADPYAPSAATEKRDYAAIERFLGRGGRVLATGFYGAYFVPGGRTGQPTQLLNGLCATTPEGPGPLAAVGTLNMYGPTPWTAVDPLVRVDQWCGSDAVVVHRPYANGGMAIWLSSAEPLTNRGLRQDNDLRLLLAAIGPTSRRVLFAEFYHGAQAQPVDYLAGLPLRSLMLQAALLLALLLFSYSRRSGPLRQPVRIPRASPVEFAQNLGALYSRAGATQSATEAARLGLLNFLHESCGLPADVVRGPAADIAALVHTRFYAESSQDSSNLQRDLERADDARYDRLRPREALAIVRALDGHVERLRNRMTQTAAQGKNLDRTEQPVA